jgi:2-dehydro-3-deoxygluconokinase
MRIACIGEPMIELAMADPPVVGVAGDTLNTAIYLKRAAPDLTVDYVTRLGRDPFSDRIRAFIAAHGIGTARIETSESRIPGLYAITLSPEGERSFTYWRGESAAREMFQGAGGPDFTALEGYDLLYLSAITLAILPDAMRAALLAHVTASPAQLAFDSNYRPKLWEDAATARATLSAWWQAADIALPSVDDEMALTGETADGVAERFRALGMRGALKRGAAGPLSLGPDLVPDRDWPPAPRVVDTTAAGDSFNGAYLGCLLSGGTQVQALAAGHACAARVVGFRGAIAPAEET